MIKVTKQFDFVVIGGGISGLCMAISAARNGVNTALVQNRSMLGGNASSEMRVHVNGAERGGNFRNALESGIIMEILMANKNVNPESSYHIWDTVLWEKAKFQENLELFLNTNAFDLVVEDNKITKVIAVQNTTEIEFTFEAKYFADTTGDGTISAMAGADFTIGHEARSTYNESLAPEEANNHVMGSSCLFSMKDAGVKSPFKRPEWAYEYTREMLGKRGIPELTHGYWWIELDGEISETEDIKTELMKYLYGVFDYIKNSDHFPKEQTENLVIDWISSIAGKRESRRVYGDYVLNQNDIDKSVRFADAVAYGGWTMDDHSVGGIKSINPQERGTIWHPIKDIYTIPYRSIYSRNINNLYIGGRCFSASHMALSSARVMATGATMGQAAGVAVAIALRENISPREVGQKYIDELQQRLIRDDCYIPGIPARDDYDLVKKDQVTITASSSIPGGEATNINGDYARRVDDVQNCWISAETISDEWINIDFGKSISAREVVLRFDPNFSCTLIPTQSYRTRARQPIHMPLVLVKDYVLLCEKDGNVVKEIVVNDNFQRLNKLDVSGIDFDNLKVVVKSTYGDKHARIFDIRVYA
ncbi:FAD-dependent oxidoreductase [Candidatus Epulonipiscium viviparus]|uniref:FAD-dependent oxidoreductase n=1 Tax=Candidatus Epulonipiscium viviparus TaxID=420336 RepID=UPI00016BFD9B|nr:FAD-dependent oxidoreductase [Candidatus Epulopiscium viviparus]